MRKNLLSSLWIYSLCTFPSIAFAVPTPNEKMLSQTFITCTKDAHGIIEQANCLSDETEYQDKRLNKIYKELQLSLDTSQKNKLISSQRIWLQLRDSDQELESTLYGDSQTENLQLKFNDLQRLAIRADLLQSYLDLIK